MTSVVEEVRARVRAGGLLASGMPVVAMLSGGRDSVCLLDVLVNVCGPERVTALHVNYGLRVEADAEEDHCRELCARLGVELHTVSARREEHASGNLHAWAREVRYAAALDLAERLDAGTVAGSRQLDTQAVAGSARVTDETASGARRQAAAVLATGHTASDQVETILYRLAASPGRRALLGMVASKGRLLRPLLSVTREQTAAYCRERGLAWRDDPSNDSERYARTRVRAGLLPALAAVHPAAAANVLRTAEALREESELLDALVDAELAGAHSIAIERLRRLPAALRRLIVIRLAEDAAGTFVPQAGERVAEILGLAERGELHVGGLAGARIESGELHMVKIEPRAQREPRTRHGSDTQREPGTRQGSDTRSDTQ
jgi:tRNA(Ile)-lysidine synthase